MVLMLLDGLNAEEKLEKGRWLSPKSLKPGMKILTADKLSY